ncbi:endonuclease [Chitinophaga sp. NPDC101104]|uniref:endonuclease n=1 Tax=Chitinophaga sp. NPDC101104 TaxID=3390561 RepID=UPI003D05F9A8
MPEGPSIVILKEALAPFSGKKVLAVAGTEKSFDLQLLKNKTAHFRTWGKHFLICFPKFTVRVHFLLFGSYLINDRKKAKPRLHLRFRNGEVNFYAGSVQLLTSPLDEIYDWSADLLNDAWDPRHASQKLKDMPRALLCDALLDQNIFAGAGNIFKNEVPWRIRVHPGSRVGALPARKRSELVKAMHDFAFDFLSWKKAGVLKQHWNVHTKTECPRCNIPLEKSYMGKGKRRTYYCNNCQKKYT